MINGSFVFLVGLTLNRSAVSRTFWMVTAAIGNGGSVWLGLSHHSGQTSRGSTCCGWVGGLAASQPALKLQLCHFTAYSWDFGQAIYPACLSSSAVKWGDNGIHLTGLV